MSSEVHQSDSPVAQFISQVIEPQRHEMHQWKNTMKHQGILLEDAQKRRRVTPTKMGPSFLFVHRGRRIGGVDSRTTTLVSGQARDATQSVELGHEYLRASSVSTSAGRSFHVSQFDAADKYREQSGTPVTARPASERAKPVASLAVSSKEDLRREWSRSTEALAHLKSVNQLIHIEHYSPNLALRVYVVAEESVAAVARIPFYIAGDGRSSVRQLLKRERERRESSEYLRSRVLAVGQEHLAQMGVSLEQTLSEGEIRVLGTAPEAEAGGGFSVDVFADLSDDLKNLAIDAMWAFPGLTGTAVDIQTPSLDSAEGATVSNVVPTADISEFLYPAYGEPRRCGVRIIDQMIRRS